MADNDLLPEQLARIKIDNQLLDAGWDIVTRDEYVKSIVVPLPPYKEQKRIVEKINEIYCLLNTI